MGAVRIGRVEQERGRPESYLLAAQPSGLAFQDIPSLLGRGRPIPALLEMTVAWEEGWRKGREERTGTGVRLAAGSPEPAELVFCSVGSKHVEKRQCHAEVLLATCRSPGEPPGSDLLWLLCVAAIGRRTEGLWWGEVG